MSRSPTEVTIFHASVSRHDAKGLDQAVPGHSVAVPHGELLGNPDVLEKMLDV